MSLHTDREILQTIFSMYEKQYPAVGDPLVPVDLPAVAKKLDCSPELLGARLIHDMAHRFSYTEQRGDIKVGTHLFEIGPHRVNFPLLVATLASMNAEHNRNNRASRLSVAAIVVSAVSATAALLAHAPNLLSLGDVNSLNERGRAVSPSLPSSHAIRPAPSPSAESPSAETNTGEQNRSP
jgi:hypothetical protein